MIHTLTESFTSTGFVGSEGTSVTFTTVLSVPGGMLTGLSGDEVTFSGSEGVVAPAGGTPPAEGVVPATDGAAPEGAIVVV